MIATPNTLSARGRTFLICEDAREEHGEYSATPGDYFWMRDDEEFRCEECGAGMVEAERVSDLREVMPR